MAKESATTQLADYLQHLLAERRMSPHTVSNYQRDLGHLQALLTEQGLKHWQQLQSHHIRELIAARRQAGLGASSLHRLLSSIRGFYRWLQKHHLADHDPSAGIKAPKREQKLPQVLEIEEVGQLTEAPLHSLDPNDPLVRRDSAIMELFYSSGLRLSELAQLERYDYDPGERAVTIRHGKGNKQRRVPVGRLAAEAIQKWLKLRPQIASSDSRALFVSQRGQALSVRSIQARLNHWAKLSGVNKPVHPHLLRHSFASHMLQSSGDLRAVQELLGHADISTTQIYTHLDYQHLAKVYDQAHPRAQTKAGKTKS